MARILVVEDELELREIIVEELTDEGHVTIEAVHGREGLHQEHPRRQAFGGSKPTRASLCFEE